MTSKGPESDDSWDNIINIIGLTPEDPLDKFSEIWYQIFLWFLFSSIFVHVIAGLIAFCHLRKHPLGRWTPLGILIMGVMSPLTGGVISSTAVAGVYRASDITLMPFYALVWGVGQTVVVVIISFLRILATL